MAVFLSGSVDGRRRAHPGPSGVCPVQWDTAYQLGGTVSLCAGARRCGTPKIMYALPCSAGGPAAPWVHALLTCGTLIGVGVG